MDTLPSHPFADLFALLSPDSIPKWTSVVDLLRRLNDQEHQLGGQDDAGTENWLEKLENARNLLRETEEQLVELYFDRHIHDLAEASAVAIGEVQYTRTGDQEPPPELALDLGAEVARQQAGSEIEYEGDAKVEICRRLMEAVDLAEEVSGQGNEVHDLDHIEDCENAEIHTVSHQAAGNSDRAIEVHDLHIEEECENAHIQAASHPDDGASIEAIEARDLDVEEWGNSHIRDTACGQAGGVECEGNAEVKICQRLKCGMDWDEFEGASGQAGDGRDVDIEELEMAFVEVANREGSASHEFEGASGQAAGEEDPDEDEGDYKDVEMS